MRILKTEKTEGFYSFKCKLIRDNRDIGNQNQTHVQELAHKYPRCVAPPPQQCQQHRMLRTWFGSECVKKQCARCGCRGVTSHIPMSQYKTLYVLLSKNLRNFLISRVSYFPIQILTGPGHRFLYRGVSYIGGLL
ncbi:hypothetical protein BGX38DRAFT_781367 [Terfezia claveryi]|nr:hypothetical protein BGX38DRAFT_781367 [Terfezia claveryi]